MSQDNEIVSDDLGPGELETFTLPEPVSPPRTRTILTTPPLLKPGEIILPEAGGPPYKVEHVNESRAYCVPLKGGEGINISPRSIVERVSLEQVEARKRQAKEPRNDATQTKERSVATAAAIPMSTKSNRQINKDQRDKMEARRRADRSAGIGVRGGTGNLARAKSKTAKPPKTVRKCGCGCGEETMSYFAPGHDARYHGWVKKLASGVLRPEDLSAAQRKALGELKKSGKGYAPVLNYKGEKHVASH